MTQPTVSVVMATRNRNRSLDRAVQSVLDQTFDDLEVIVVDDAPGHPAESLLEKYADSRIRYFYLPTRMGAAGSRNVGIKAANGQFITFLDDDDIYLERKIEEQIKVFERCPPSVGLVYCGYTYRDEAGRITWTAVPKRSRWKNLYHNEFIGIGPLVRKRCFDEVGLFDEELVVFEDIDMWFRISQKYDFELCREVLYEAAYHSKKRDPSELDARLMSLDRYYRKHSKKFESVTRQVWDRVRSNYHMERALSYFHFGREREMKEEAKRSLRYFPFSIKCWKLLFFWSTKKQRVSHSQVSTE